ncbi:MAG TPA: serine/threonine-protein kinase, partial [Myxococcales bacterium]|nr:serine/threonine-protein kinase [Myxococcales bacterium]
MQIEPLPAGTTASLAPDAVRAGAPREVPQIVGGRFRVLSLRGRGAEATVYLAIDLFSGREVALKIGPPARLEAEYRRSAELIHPHLAQPIALWRGPASAALAFEYGAEDLTALRGAPEPLIVRHVAGVARALGHLHRRGIVHGDVKPANAVLAGPPEDRRALLVDLGLAGADPVARGSLEYAAPEVIEGAAPEMASDLYSLGVTLHELISGSNPFARSTAAEVIRARFEHQPPPSRASAGVQAVVSKLLAREPRSRYAQADEVIEALAAATGLSLEADGSGLGSDAIGMGPLHGREAELARLELAARRAAAGEGEQLLLAGAPGSGRTRLLRAAAVAAELAGLRTIHLCHGEGLAALCRRLGLLIGAAAPLTPSVGAGRERLAMACAQHPLAVLIDDADRSDDWLPALLLAIAHDPAWKRRPLLLVATASLQTDLPVELIEVQPLAVAEAKARLMEILGPQDWAEGVADRIVAESGGCPRDLEEAIADLEQRGLLRRRAGRWELDRLRAGPGSSGCVPRPALRAAREAVVALPPQRRAELGIAAVLWQDIDAAALGGLDADAVAGGLRIAEEMGRHLSQLALFRAAEGALPPGERRNAHLRAAGMAKDPAARAAHLFRAREDGALRAGLAAARGELRRGFPGTAARLYEMAEAAARRPLWHPRTAVLAERAGDCLALAGHAQAARQSYFRALGRGGAPGRIWQKVAKAHWQEGRFESVLQALLRAREGGGDALAVATIEARAEAMRGNYARAEELAREALPLARERGDAAQATRLHHLLGTSAWHRGDGRRAAVEERVAVLIARRIGDARAEADARAGLGTAWKLLANYERSARETSRAVELYRALGDERQESIAWNNLGVARYLAGNWSGALEAWERLAQKKTQTLEEELLTLNNLGFLYRERGDLPRARELLDNAISKIRSAGGYARIEAMARGNLGETAARAGDLAAAERLYGEALEIARRIGARDEVVETGRRRCELDLLRRDAAGAAARAAETLDLAVQSANVVEQGNLWRVLAMAARVRGDAVAAASAIGKAHQLLRGVSSVLEDARVDCVECLLDLDRGEP